MEDEGLSPSSLGTSPPSFATKMRLSSWLFAAGLAAEVAALGASNMPRYKVKPYTREPLQDIVTWDQHSIFVRGERVMFYSGEFHPFRLPVPGLWLDVFQKIRAMGYTGVSFYPHWALLEGKRGEFSAEGVFAFEPFFEAASQAGIYLLARPGPYVNAEISGGGFPGWVRVQNTCAQRGILTRPPPISCKELPAGQGQRMKATSKLLNCMRAQWGKSLQQLRSRMAVQSFYCSPRTSTTRVPAISTRVQIQSICRSSRISSEMLASLSRSLSTITTTETLPLARQPL